MLSGAIAYATLPTSDVTALRRFYEDVLGFVPQQETPTTIYYGAGEGTLFAISRSAGEASGTHTQLAFRVSNIEETVADLRGRGVVLEEYETPEMVDGIADMGAGRAAWLRDPDGNLIGIWQFKPAAVLVADRERREAFAAGPRITIALGSIVDLDVDAIVNAANSSLQGGGGVDGAVHRAAGPGLADETRPLAPCPPGESRITGGHRLRARHVIHTVGPMWAGGDRGEPETLASCYRTALALAEAAGATSIAFPAISTGIYGYPAARAASVAAREIAAWLDGHELPETVILSAFSADTAIVLRRALSDLGRPDLTGA
jgi:O-acetyl-ADP-ribose deacetylase (regulator of RNase III)/catechol 2,3-dioxygenase-like lactoylglutathione lyase family enzyme